MAERVKIGCIQMCSGVEVAANIEAAEALIREAAAGGATLIFTPENTSSISPAKAAGDLSAKGHPAIPAFAALAKELQIWLAIGSIGVKLEDGRFANRSHLFGPDGGLVATYDKIHMFDVAVSEKDTWQESDTYRPGEEAVLAETPWAKLGLTICYDMRFPHLTRDLAKAGAGIIAAPSAFTRPTGAAHWHVLLRARAIETGAFVIAAAQTGVHENGRETYGHSLVVDPWGRIVAEREQDPGVLICELDLSEIAKARGRLPSLSHDRPYRAP